MQSYTHFTLSERENLRILLEQGKGLRQIARELGRNPSTVCREMKRNGKRDGSYNAWWGTSLYLGRRKHCRRHYRLQDDPALEAFVISKLNCFWSPEIIVVKWKQEHPNAKLSSSTIYTALRKKRLPGCSEREYLLRRGKHRFKSTGNTGLNPVNPDHTIREWTAQIKSRSRFGDWECDTIRGGLGKGYLVTCVDRMSRYVALGSLPGKRSKAETMQAMCQALDGLPVGSLTMDNGTEFAGHRQIAERLHTTIYFADKGCPWQRGSNEHVNGLLRFFFPKGCDLRNVGQEELKRVESLLNNRPRKCLGWLSPIDFLAKCCT